MNHALNVTLRQLRVFIEVARLQSFSRAGDEIGLTQSAVSRCVRELEAEIGLKLVDRTTREVQLTDVGDDLVGSVRGCDRTSMKRCAKSAISASNGVDEW